MKRRVQLYREYNDQLRYVQESLSHSMTTTEHSVTEHINVHEAREAREGPWTRAAT